VNDGDSSLAGRPHTAGRPESEANQVGEPQRWRHRGGVVAGQYSDKTVQFINTGGSGITIQGSLDTDPATTDWETLNDPQGSALADISSDRIENILEGAYQLRPSAGAGVSGATVWLLLASTR
jgi:hypothetical protein